MTSLSGEFQTDLGIDDAMVACTEAIDGLGWRIDTVDAQRVIAFTDSGEHPPRIEVGLNETGGGTEFRIIGSDNEQNQLEQDDLIAVLDKARDAINRSMEDAERPRGSSSSTPAGQTQERQAQSGEAGGASTPAGWYPDVYDDSRQRYWDGEQWTDDFRPADGDRSKPESSSRSESKPEKKSRKEAREEKRQQSRERAEQRRKERLDKRQERTQQSGAAAGGAAAGGAAARAATAGGNESPGGGNGTGGNSPGRGEGAPQESPESAIPSQFRSLHLIATLYQYLGYLVVVGGVIAAIATAANADGVGNRIAALIVVLIGAAFSALFVFAIAAAIRLALAVEKNTRDTAELLRRDRGD